MRMARSDGLEWRMRLRRPLHNNKWVTFVTPNFAVCFSVQRPARRSLSLRVEVWSIPSPVSITSDFVVMYPSW